jgi:hypothetical protein
VKLYFGYTKGDGASSKNIIPQEKPMSKKGFDIDSHWSRHLFDILQPMILPQGMAGPNERPTIERGSLTIEAA